jgi:hypothetical protein
MFHLEDAVEEIATKRIGKLDSSGGTVGQEPDSWRVYFSDGKTPLMKYFKCDELDQLRLVKCPHEPVEPGFVPSTSIMG